MLRVLKRIFNNPTKEITEFERNNPLGFGGERVDFIYDKYFDYSKLDIYQKNHYHRYDFAIHKIEKGKICGDFACGSGYGSVMLGTVAGKVIGADLNKRVISEIKKRYIDKHNIEFLNKNLLKLDFENLFSSIVSFETIEHFSETEIHKILESFNKSLKKNGTLIMSTPYLQEESYAAKELGFHKTFQIDEVKIREWFKKANFNLQQFYYQDYRDHEIKKIKDNPDFIISIATKS